jgi:Fuc2NAc and GlcNAc transferase
MYLLLAVVFVASFTGTAMLRRYALAKNVIDIPNARSSHTVPTPRGGGVAIVISFLFGLIVAAGTSQLDTAFACWLGGAALLIAIVGFIDDHQHIPAQWRLLCHFSGAAMAVYAIGGLPVLSYFGVESDLGLSGDLLAVVAVVWMINLTNFMDGIDGIASIQAICLSLGMALLLFLHQQQVFLLPLLLAGAAAGFLCWNFPPARIFMGDAGSGCLGLLLAGLILYCAQISPLLFWSGVILFAVFIVDATFTLIVRLKRGKKLYEAHRSHAYQIASRRFGQHKTVTLLVLAVNIGWLLPWALLVSYQIVNPQFAVAVAYLPLLWTAFTLKAGHDE